MNERLPPPGSAARLAEEKREMPKAVIEPGSAARTAEQSSHQSSAVQPEAFRGKLTIRNRSNLGVQFQFAAQHDGPGEALPEGYKPPHPALDLASHQRIDESQAGPCGENLPTRAWAARFRKLFGR